MHDGLAPPIAAPLGAVQTERLLLRRFEATDLDGLAEVFAHPEVWQYPYGRAFTRSETQRNVRRWTGSWSWRRSRTWDWSCRRDRHIARASVKAQDSGRLCRSYRTQQIKKFLPIIGVATTELNPTQSKSHSSS